MVIELKFDKYLDRLIGFKFGKEIYLNQVNIMPIAEVTILSFPKSIERVSISFVQGFISEYLKTNTIDDFYNEFKVIGNETFVSKFYKYINYW